MINLIIHHIYHPIVYLAQLLILLNFGRYTGNNKDHFEPLSAVQEVKPS